MSVKEAVVTSVKVAAIVIVLYLLGYFVFVAPGKFGISPTIGRFLVKTLYLYPNRAPEDLNIWHIEDMSRTVLFLCAVFIPVALYRKMKKQS